MAPGNVPPGALPLMTRMRGSRHLVDRLLFLGPASIMLLLFFSVQLGWLPSTGRGATASTTRGTRARVETFPTTWPPASTPCAMMTSTPASAARRASATEPT